MAHPLISVILPSYNHAGFVAEAVNSVLNQTLRDIELIVVDDGSIDGTPDIVEKIHDPRLKLIRLSQNRLRQPRNLGLSLSKGQFIAFQNSDDVWMPEKLESQLSILEKHRNAAVSFTNVDIIDHNGIVIKDSWANNLFSSENRSQLLWLRHFFEIGNCLCISSALVRRNMLEQAGKFNGSFIQLSDFDLWVRLAAIGDFHILSGKLTLFRDTTRLPAHESNNRNLSAPNANTQHRSVIEFAKLLNNYIEEPIISLLASIFPEIIPTEPNTKSIQLAHLAKHAWSLNSIHHSLFSDHVISQIMTNELTRGEVTDHFGAEIFQEFVNRRGNLDIRFSDQLSAMSNQLTASVKDKEQTINEILESHSWKLTHPLRLIGSALKRIKGSK